MRKPVLRRRLEKPFADKEVQCETYDTTYKQQQDEAVNNLYMKTQCFKQLLAYSIATYYTWLDLIGNHEESVFGTPNLQVVKAKVLMFIRACGGKIRSGQPYLFCIVWRLLSARDNM